MWAIGIKTGKSPLSLSDPPGLVNPVLSAADVTDVPALFVADPFMLRHQNTWHMLFEVMNGDTRRGEIGLATSPDALTWQYRNIVLREPFHLSYPSLFPHEGEIFMLPETRNLGRVLIYRADPFPFHWKLHAELTGIQGADPTIFRHGGKLWMYICSEGHETLRLYSAAQLEGPWLEHPASPIVSHDARRARPAGPVVLHQGTLIRFAQDCGADYGMTVRAFAVTELTPTTYAESECAGSPVCRPSGSGWESRRVHHMDAQFLGSGQDWIACVDGNQVFGTRELQANPPTLDLEPVS